MSELTLFYMWGPFRESLVKRHLFYVEQARKRLLSQFEAIEADADRAEEEWLEQSAQHFDQDRHDPGDFYEEASGVGIESYRLLSDMREQTRLSVVAGMFHEWEKQLRDWLVDELRRWHRGDNTRLAVWKAGFAQIGNLLEKFGWKLRATHYFRTLEACQLVVNVYKHGDGESLNRLRARFPEYLEDPFKERPRTWQGEKHHDHTHLKVTEGQIQAFSDAIVAFWREVPDRVTESQLTDIPDWFEKALLKDRSELQQKSKK